MTTFLLVIHLFVTLALIGVVLIQRSEGGGLGIGTTGGMGSFMGGRGTTNLLTRATAVLATIFMLLSLTLALLNRGTAGVGRSILDDPAPPPSAATQPSTPSPVPPRAEGTVAPAPASVLAAPATVPPAAPVPPVATPPAASTPTVPDPISPTTPTLPPPATNPPASPSDAPQPHAEGGTGSVFVASNSDSVYRASIQSTMDRLRPRTEDQQRGPKPILAWQHVVVGGSHAPDVDLNGERPRILEAPPPKAAVEE